MSHRHEQMAASIRRAVQEVLARGLQDPRLDGCLATLTEVTVSPDLRNATLLVSVLPEDKQELALHGLRAAARHIRREVGELVETRQLPEFTFKLDQSLKKQAAVLQELDRAREERERRGGTRAAE